VPAARVQGLPVKVPEPAGAAAKVTLPVGVVGVAEVSLTLAVQDEAVPRTREEGLHETVVVVKELIKGAITGRSFAGLRPALNPAGEEELATVDPRPETVASDVVVRSNTKHIPTVKMRNASAACVLLEV